MSWRADFAFRVACARKATACCHLKNGYGGRCRGGGAEGGPVDDPRDGGDVDVPAAQRDAHHLAFQLGQQRLLRVFGGGREHRSHAGRPAAFDENVLRKEEWEEEEWEEEEEQEEEEKEKDARYFLNSNHSTSVAAGTSLTPVCWK